MRPSVLAVVICLATGARGAAPTAVPKTGPSSSPAAVIHAIQSSFQTARPLDPALRPLALSYGLSPGNWDKLAAVDEHARAEESAEALLPASTDKISKREAKRIITSLDRTLSAIPLERIQDPRDIDLILRRLWDGLQFSSRGRLDTREYWDYNRSAILAETRILKERVQEHARAMEESLGTEEFNIQLEKDAVKINDPALGSAEVNTVDGRRFVRVVHAPTQLSVLFLDQDAVSRDSLHLRRIIGRQFFDAGKDRKDGHAGRNPVLAWEKNGTLVETDFREKPEFNTKAWWAHYWDATYKKPAKAEKFFGVVMAALQGILASILIALKAAYLGTPIAWTPVAFTMLFGFAIGYYISTYKNWTYRGPWYMQFLKSAVISVAFAYPVVIFSASASMLAWATHAHIAANVVLNNLGKIPWQQIPRMMDKYRTFGNSQFWGLPISSWLNQFFYMINWTLRLADLLRIPWGKSVFVAGIVLAMILSYWYAKAHGYSEAAEMRRKFKRTFSALFT